MKLWPYGYLQSRLRDKKSGKRTWRPLTSNRAYASICLSFFISFGSGLLKAQANDWGYDGMETPPPPQKTTTMPEEQSAASLTKSLLKPDKTATPNRAKAASQKQPVNKAGKIKESDDANVTKVGIKAPNSSAPPVIPKSKLPPPGESLLDSSDSYIDKDMQAARCWLQLFQACSKQPMDYTQQKVMEAYVLGRERQGSKSKDEFRSILLFWPKLIDDLRKRPEMEMHYADLFKALLRLHEHNSPDKTNVDGSQFSSDADLVSELLGLQRMAVAGDPPFTEDAVNAYADMAVFIYEQQHAGRTIDANDNRTLFAKVVVEKFNRAPTDADRRAMASFDLAWAKFKIIWFSTDDKTRQTLLEKLVKTGANSSLTVSKDPLLELVLANWPWKTTP